MTAKATYLLALLLLVGTQLATSKSVDEIFKDDQLTDSRTLLLSKRDVNQKNKEDEAVTTEEPNATTPDDQEDEEEIKETTPAPVVTTARPKKLRRRRPSTTPAPTTAAPDDYEDEETAAEEVEEEAPTVKPLVAEKEKPKSAKKPKPGSPQIFNRVKEDDEESPAPSSKPAANRPAPASNLLPPMPLNFVPTAYAPQPSFAAPWGFNPLPATGPYDYPYPSGPAFSDSNVGAFASASASAGGSGGSVSASYPGGASNSGLANPSFSVSRSGFPESGGSVSSSASYPGSSSSISGSGNNVKFSTSAFPGGSGASVSASSSYPGGAGGSASFPSRIGGTPQYSSEKVPGGKIEKVVTDSFVSVRGSFGPDDDSVGIEVNGPAAGGAGSAPAAGAPAYANAGPNYGSINGPGYSASASFGNTPYASPYYNTIPTYSTYNPADFQNAFQQYFANLQAQQLAFQQQLQAQIQAQQQAAPGGVSTGPQSSSVSVSLGPNGGFQSGQISPASPGFESRFGETIPAPSGNNYGVFSSSSSSSSVGPDGKQTSHKSATVGVNDNGKVTIKTVHDP